MVETGPEIHGLSGAYAVDALDELERARFEQHLASCSTCLEEVFGLRETAAALAIASALEPPASLRAGVLAGIGTIRPLPPLVPADTSVEDSTVPLARADGAGSPVTPPVHLDGARRRRTARLSLLVAAVLALVAGVGAVVWQPWDREPTSQLTAADRVLGADDAQHFPVVTDDGSRVEVVRSLSQDGAVVMADDMPAAPDGKVYQLWLQVDGEFVDAGLMPPGGDHTMLFEGDADAANGAGITVEPAGGSTSPTTDPVVLVDFTRA